MVTLSQSSISATTSGWNQNRRVELLEYDGSDERRPGRNLETRVDRGLDRALVLVERDGAPRDRLGHRAGALVPRELGLGRDPHGANRQPVDLDRRAVAPVAVLALVLSVEAARPPP